MTDSLLRMRADFPILDRTTYLVSNSLGAMPRTVPERLAEYAAIWAEQGVKAWAQGWWEMPVTAGDEIAPLIGAEAGGVAMVPSVTLAQATICSALEYTPGRDTIVMTEFDFPSVRYMYESLGRRLGARIVVVPSDDGIGIDMARLIEAIDERTCLVAISHVLFRSAYIIDLNAVCAHAHSVGAMVSADAFHSVGVIPVDVRASGVDFLSGGVLKWLCGGPGGCFMYVAPAVRERLAPALTGWQAHARPFGFEQEMDYGAGMWRWLGGTPTIPSLYAATEGPKALRRAGIEAVREKSVRQTRRLIELADARGYTVRAPREDSLRGGTVALDVPNSFEVSRVLLERDILVDFRPGAGIRIAPHFYTSDAELDTAIAAIDDALESGAWRRHSGSGTTVT